MFSAGVGVGSRSHFFLNCWSRSRFFKTAGVGVGSRSRFFKTAGVVVRSRSRNPKKSSDSTTLLVTRLKLFLHEGAIKISNFLH